MSDYREQFERIPDLIAIRDEAFARHTTFQIGGPVKLWCTTQTTEALVVALDVARSAGVSYLLWRS